MFDANKLIINNDLSYLDINQLYELKKVLLPLMIHENYPKKIWRNSKNNLKTNLYNMIKISILYPEEIILKLQFILTKIGFYKIFMDFLLVLILILTNSNSENDISNLDLVKT